MQTQNPQNNNVSECLPKKFDRKAYQKAWYKSNKEKIREARKAYYEANKEKLNEQSKAYYEANREKLNEQNKAYYEANREKIREARKAYYEADKERMKSYYEANKEKRKAYREANKEKVLKSKKTYYEANKEKILEVKKAYREANKEKILEANKAYRKKRKKEDLLFAVKEKLRNCVYQSFKRIAQNKPTDTQTLLGCSWTEAREHFERLFKEGMSWENHGEWHIDHIRPVSSFSEDELHLMNHISNLQPLWEDENLSKGATIPPTPLV